MVKGLIEEDNLINIANAIREKTGENSVYYPSEMADKILSIQTGGGGLELTTSLILTSDVTETTGSVVLTAVLKADYDTVDTDLHGFLSNATILLYDGNNVLLDTGVTNDNGVVVFNKTISEDTTFYCVFDGTSDYEACISNEITVELETHLFYDKCDSATGLSNYGEIIRVEGTPYTAIMEYDSSMNAYKLTSTSAYPKIYPIPVLDTLDNIQITVETYVKSDVYNQTGIGLAIIGSNYSCVGTMNSKEMDIMRHRFNNYSWKGNDKYLGDFQSNKWIRQILTKQGNTLTNRFEELDGTEITTIPFTLDSNFNNQSDIKYGIDIGWSSYSCYGYIRNIKVVNLSGE